jgi:hypothetical protein
MASQQLIALAAAQARLKQSRFTKIEAVVSPKGSMTSGAVTVTTEVSLKKHKTDQADALSSVNLRIIGTAKDAKTNDPPSFEISVTAVGVYEWDKLPTNEVMESKFLCSQLAKPLHVLAVSEALSIARKLGLQGVRLNWEVPAPAPLLDVQEKKSLASKTDVRSDSPLKTKRLISKKLSI